MKLPIAAFVAAGLIAAALPARADDIDMSSIKCSDFVSSKKDDIAIILAWLEGYYTKSKPILYVDKMQKDAAALSEYCNKNKDDGLIKAADSVVQAK